MSGFFTWLRLRCTTYPKNIPKASLIQIPLLDLKPWSCPKVSWRCRKMAFSFWTCYITWLDLVFGSQSTGFESWQNFPRTCLLHTSRAHKIWEQYMQPYFNIAWSTRHTHHHLPHDPAEVNKENICTKVIHTAIHGKAKAISHYILITDRKDRPPVHNTI